MATAEARAKICETCEHCKGVTRTKHRFAIYTVKCGLCGCAGMSLATGACRADKWPAVPAADHNGHVARGNGSAAKPQKLLLRCHLSPGDVVTLTAAVRDLHRAHPGRCETDVDTTAGELWEHNPYVTRFNREDPDVRVVPMHYPLVNQSNQRPLHFLWGYAEFLASQLNVPIPLTEFRGDIHLSAEERSWTNQVEQTFGYKGPFWIMMAGGK